VIDLGQEQSRFLNIPLEKQWVEALRHAVDQKISGRRENA